MRLSLRASWGRGGRPKLNFPQREHNSSTNAGELERRACRLPALPACFARFCLAAMAGDEDDGASKASEPTKEEAISLIPSQDVASWLLSKNFLLSAYELWFELEDSRDASDPTEPQARNKLRDYFKDPKRFPPQELSAMATQDGASKLVAARCLRVSRDLCENALLAFVDIFLRFSV